LIDFELDILLLQAYLCSFLPLLVQYPIDSVRDLHEGTCQWTENELLILPVLQWLVIYSWLQVFHSRIVSELCVPSRVRPYTLLHCLSLSFVLYLHLVYLFLLVKSHPCYLCLPPLHLLVTEINKRTLV